MTAPERFLKQATRGLWGKQKQDAMTELRGAVEDKIYRHRLCGLSEQEAERAALRDLGSPGAIARDLNSVHTRPQIARMTLLLGVAGLLGIQAAAQLVTVKSVYLPVDAITECGALYAAERALLSATKLKAYDTFIAVQGGPDAFQQKCAKSLYGNVVMLKVADLLSALRGAGVAVDQAELTPTTPLMVLGGARHDLPKASYSTTEINGGRYLDSSMVVPYLTRVTSAPLRLSGLSNPVVSVGAARLQLGTTAAPVQTTDLLSAALVDARRTDPSVPIPSVVEERPSTLLVDPAAPTLAVPGQDGDLYAVVQNILRVNGGENDTLWVRSRQGGRISFTDEVGVRPRLVTTLAALDAATARREKAALVYRLDAPDLRRLRLTPVAATQLRVVQP